MATADPILIAGPTASGKSRLALDIAKASGGLVINADAIQVYTELKVITSRPSDAETAEVPHRLYGHIPAAERYSVGLWLGDVAGALAEARLKALRPIIVGGTGLYFRALTQGLASVPDVPATIRTAWRERAATLSTADLHALLAERSAVEGERVRPTDRSRILRALEVLDATGRPLPDWQAEAAEAALVNPATATKLVINPSRVDLYDLINRRFLRMLKAGALEEARKVAAQKLDPELPAMKSIGLTALLSHLRGEVELDEAIATAQTETRNYAKRQMTWFRNQMPDWPAMDYAAAEATLREAIA